MRIVIMRRVCTSRVHFVTQELYATIPIVHIVAVPIDQKITVDLYDCPVYVTAARGPTYVFTAGLKTRELPLKWILAGVAALMEIEE